MSLCFAQTFANKDRVWLESFIAACDITRRSEDVRVWLADICAFQKRRLDTTGGAFAIAEYLQITRGNGLELHGVENVFELMTPTELATFVEDLVLRELVEGAHRFVLENFASRVLMSADVSLEDYTEAIDVLVECLY